MFSALPRTVPKNIVMTQDFLLTNRMQQWAQEVSDNVSMMTREDCVNSLLDSHLSLTEFKDLRGHAAGMADAGGSKWERTEVSPLG